LILIPSFCLGQSTETIQKAKFKASSYIKENLLFPKSYISVKWSPLWVKKTSYYTTSESKEILNKLLAVKDSIANSDVDVPDKYSRQLDSLLNLDDTLKSQFKSQTLYTLIHVFKAKNSEGQLDLKTYIFSFDKDLNILDVNADNTAKKIQDLENKKKRLELDQ
jgi:hypothetical protein